MSTYWIYIMCFISLVQSITNCPSQCTCQGNAVDCTNRNIRNPPKTYPSGTHAVNLNQNRIYVLGPRSFQRQQTLEVMKVSGNNIRVIRAYAFRPFSNLLTLDLSNNQIVKIYGRGFKGMNKVRTISLSNNRLRSVSRVFLSTPNLFQLNLGFNQIRKLGEGDFGANSELHYLDLRNNKISAIHRNAFKNLVKLRTLFLNNNPLSTLPGELKFGSQVLQLLDFSSCQLSVVPKGLPSSIEDLRFGLNRLTRINQSDLANVTGLKMITFNENQIERFEYFALGNAKSLEEVWLRANKLVYIPRGLPDSVKKVHMHSNMVHQIEGRLFTDKSQLEYLDISNNHVSNISTEAFTGLMKLGTLNFEGNQLTDLKPGTFENLETLKSIFLGNNPIETIQAGAFRNLPNLTTLTLNYNPNEEVQINENFLIEMPNLETLNLMASIGMSKTILAIVRDNNFVMEHITEVILTYNNLRKLSSSFQDTFPNIEKIPIDGNAWICDNELLWLKQWMLSTIGELTFHEYNPPKCETPFGLSGSDIIDVQDSDFVEHNEGLLNDFPYWVIEQEFNKSQDEKERKAREEKEKKDKYHKNKINKETITKNTKTNSKEKSPDHQDTKNWYQAGKKNDNEKKYYQEKYDANLNRDKTDTDEKKDAFAPEKRQQAKDNSSVKKQRNNEENPNKKHSTNRRHFKKDKETKDKKQISDQKYQSMRKGKRNNKDNPKSNPDKPKSTDQKSFKEDKLYQGNREKFDNGFSKKDKTELTDDSKHNSKYNDKDFNSFPNKDHKVENNKRWNTNKKTDDNLKKDNLKKDNLKKDNLKKDNLKKDNIKKDNLKKNNLKKDNLKKDNLKKDDLKKDDQMQKNPLEDKDHPGDKMNSIAKDANHKAKFSQTKFDHNRKKPTNVPVNKKSHNEDVKVPIHTKNLNKSSTGKDKDLKQTKRKTERKRKRKDRRRKCERNGKKCRKRKRKGRKHRKRAKLDKI